MSRRASTLGPVAIDSTLLFTFDRFGDALETTHATPTSLGQKNTHQKSRSIRIALFVLTDLLTISQVYSRLSAIQDLLKQFSVEYLRQTNLLLGEGAGVDGINELIGGFDAGLLPNVGAVLPPVAVVAAPAADEKKERKKRTHDPNAPKRPLTPYFLYMQTARPIIANDLGPEAPKGAVQEEGQRRWSTMNAHDKGVRILFFPLFYLSYSATF